MDADKMGSRIRTLRTERGLTQEGLAQTLNVSAQAVSKWENGHSLPETAILPTLSRALDCSVDSLFGQGELYILDAWYSDGFQKQSVTARLNRLVEGDTLKLDSFSAFPPIGFDKGGVYLCVFSLPAHRLRQGRGIPVRKIPNSIRDILRDRTKRTGACPFIRHKRH